TQAEGLVDSISRNVPGPVVPVIKFQSTWISFRESLQEITAMPGDNRELRDSAERLQRLLAVRPPRKHAELWRETVVSAAQALAGIARQLLQPSEGGEARTDTARAAFEAL